MFEIFLCKSINIENSLQDKIGQHTAFDMASEFPSTDVQIQTKNTDF